MKMTRLEKIKQIRVLAHMTKENLTTEHLSDLIYAQNEMERLIGQFHDEFPDLMTAEQSRDARDNYDTFLTLLDVVHADELEKSRKRDRS
jgi:hypothetical protein